jgi:hypothetical protein
MRGPVEALFSPELRQISAAPLLLQPLVLKLRSTIPATPLNWLSASITAALMSPRGSMSISAKCLRA